MSDTEDKIQDEWKDVDFHLFEHPDGSWVAHLWRRSRPEVGLFCRSESRIEAVVVVISEAKKNGMLPNA